MTQPVDAQRIATREQILTDLRTRKTSKRYDPTRKVAAEDMEVLYEALRLSASSINSQPWRFIALESETARMRMERTFARNFQYNQRHVREASHILLLAHDPAYSPAAYRRVVEEDIANLHTHAERREAALAKYAFVEMNTDADGSTASWTKAQTYIALGNALHVLARLGIDATPMEGIDSELVAQEFAPELDGHLCDVALAVGYHHAEDFNSQVPKSRLKLADVVKRI